MPRTRCKTSFETQNFIYRCLQINLYALLNQEKRIIFFHSILQRSQLQQNQSDWAKNVERCSTAEKSVSMHCKRRLLVLTRSVFLYDEEIPTKVSNTTFLSWDFNQMVLMQKHEILLKLYTIVNLTNFLNYLSLQCFPSYLRRG